ncbi:MAG: hypothetical protein PHO54_05495, partial [Candidatus Peribacteraceae bacterium]|nr:hypothetical protein [Candidatus Peribacteraceae bacterium]
PKDRLRFCSPILAKIQEHPSVQAHANKNDKSNHPGDTDDRKEKERYIRCCQRLDSRLRFAPTRIAKLLLIKYSSSGRSEKQMESNGFQLRPNFDFTHIDPAQLDVQDLSEKIRQSNGNLRQLRMTEEAGFSSEFQLYATQAELVIEKVSREIAGIRERILATISAQMAELDHDMHILARPLAPREEQPRSVLESSTGREGQKMTIALLEKQKRILRHNAEKEIDRLTEELRRILAIIPPLLRSSPRQEERPATEPTHRNGKRHSGSHKPAPVPAPVTEAAK